MAFDQHSAYISLPVVTTHANVQQYFKAYWTKVHQMFTCRKFFIDGINASIHVAIRPPVVEWQGRH